MINNYFRLLKLHSIGKRFAQFEQAWMTRINDHFSEQEVCSVLWKNVLKKCKCVTTVEEQRIVISTLMYTVYDIMTDKVKRYKEKRETTDHSVDDADIHAYHEEETGTTFIESNVSLYRYGGFALHSLLQKYKRATGKASSSDTEVVQLLEQLVIKPEQFSSLPSGIHYLNQGGLVIMNPCMLPYLRALIERVSSLVNEEQCREFGKHMIDAACTEIEKDKKVASTFLESIKHAGIDSSSSFVYPKIYNELSKKMFHARVNEFMTAAVEVELDRSGKAVKVDQCLRDQLKTFSSMKARC